MKRSLIRIIVSVGFLFLFGCSSATQTGDTKAGKESPSQEQSQPETEPTLSPFEPVDEQHPEQTTSAAVQEERAWPRFIEHEEGRLTFYQPQADHWDENSIEAQMAIEILLQGQAEPLYGSVRLQGESDTNLDERLVQISQLVVSEITIPAAKDPQKVRELKKFINFMIKDHTQTVALDRILADVATKPDSVAIRSTDVSMEPPNILVSTVPAVLLSIDGDPLLQPIADTGLENVVNANMDLYYAPGLKRYYLFAGDQWLFASELEGKWENISSLPKEFQQIPDDHERAYIKDVLKTTSERTLTVLLAEPPAEVVLIEGEPSLEPITGTSLFYVTNTEHDLFLHREEGLWYYMSSGRWFRAKRLEGPWVTASNDLPEDFRRIPQEHAKASVLIAVPGTERAREAVVEAQIPQKITVNRDETTAAVEYQGEPQFELIEGMPIAYALNTSSDVFNVGSRYYLCFQGIWFVSDTPTGPWEVSDSVPQEIYAIPPTHPKYYVTYIKVYGSTADTVTFGYTSGYTGIYVSENDTVVYGTGYYYSSSVYYYRGWPYYYWYPSTYWSFGVYWGWGWSSRYRYYYPSRYYSPHYYGRYEYRYGRYGQRATYRSGDYQARYASGSYRGADLETRQVRGPYEQWGTSTVSRSGDWIRSRQRTDDRGTVAGIETSRDGRGVAVKGDDRQGGIVKAGNNNVYVGNDGAVFKHDVNGWSSRENDQWILYTDDRRVATEIASKPLDSSSVSSSTPQRTQGSVSTETYRQLQKDRAARSRGNYSTNRQKTARSRSVSSRSRGGRGGGRGGGGRR